MTSDPALRLATAADLPWIRRIYNEGIVDRTATLDEDEKSDADIAAWWAAHDARYAVLVAEREAQLAGWASLNRYSHRCAYRGVAELSIYVARHARGTGIGRALLAQLEDLARAREFHKIVLFSFPTNILGQRLYRAAGYREVGTFENQGTLDGKFVDVVALEKLLGPR